MEQDIVNNLKSRVKKLEEELVKVVSTLQKALYLIRHCLSAWKYHKSSRSKDFPKSITSPQEAKSFLQGILNQYCTAILSEKLWLFWLVGDTVYTLHVCVLWSQIVKHTSINLRSNQCSSWAKAKGTLSCLFLSRISFHFAEHPIIFPFCPLVSLITDSMEQYFVEIWKDTSLILHIWFISDDWQKRLVYYEYWWNANLKIIF